MNTIKTLLIPTTLICSAVYLSAETIFIDFEDPDELTTNWVQTSGEPDDTMSITEGSGVGGSNGVVHVDGPQDFQVTLVHQTDIGGFKDGLSMYVKARVEQVAAGNMLHFGFSTSNMTAAGLGGGYDYDWMGAVVSFRSNLTDFRIMPWGNDVVDAETTVNYWAGPGHPESFVAIPDGMGGVADGATPVDVWIGFEMIFIDNGGGDWDVQTKIDVLNADGTAVAIDDYEVFNYSTQGADDGGPQPLLSGFSDIYNATSLYPFVATQLGAAANFAALDEVTITIPEAGSDWYGYPVDEEGYADTGDWMGYVWTGNDPWIWNYSLNKYVYVSDDSGWVYIPK
jgi:hypothetical protein